MASLWQSVLSVHQRIVDNGGMVKIVFSSHVRFILHLFKTLTVCKTSLCCVCVQCGGVVRCRCAPWRAFTMTALWLVTCMNHHDTIQMVLSCYGGGNIV